MASQVLTVNLPDALNRRLQERAVRAKRSVEAELVDALAEVLPSDDEHAADLDAAIAPLALLDDAARHSAARHRLSPEVAAELEGLHLKRQRETLSEAEAQTAAALVRQFERTMVVRAEATRLLKARGHDVSALLTAP